MKTTSELIADLKKRVASDYSDNKDVYDNLCETIDLKAMEFDNIGEEDE